MKRRGVLGMLFGGAVPGLRVVDGRPSPDHCPVCLAEGKDLGCVAAGRGDPYYGGSIGEYQAMRLLVCKECGVLFSKEVK